MPATATPAYPAPASPAYPSPTSPGYPASAVHDARPLAATRFGGGLEGAAVMMLTLLLLSFGLVTLYSASSFLAQRQGLPDYHFVVRQAMGAGAGLVVLLIFSRIPYARLQSLAWPMMLAAWLLLVFIILPGTESFAPERNGARRWLQVGPASFQPSEAAKLAILVWTAALAVKKQDLFRSLTRGLGPFLVIWAAMLVPVLLEPDFSTAALIGMLGCIIVFAAGARMAHFVFLGLLAAPVVLHQFATDFREMRLGAFLNPEAHTSGAGYQVHQSLIAIGSGGIGGVGFGEGQQKFGFLPEAHNDFIFALIGEEWGLIGVALLVCAYIALIVFGFRIARRAADLFGELLAVGCTSLIALHAFLHMGVNLSLLPATGLPLPLISDGRSNLVVTLAAIGILLSVARGIPHNPRTGHG